jgi:hypothetical protein
MVKFNRQDPGRPLLGTAGGADQHLQLSDALSRYLGIGESTLITGARGGSVAATVIAQPLIGYRESCHTE